MKNFSEAYWCGQIERPDWYIGLLDYLKSAEQALGDESEEFVKLRRRVRQFFAEQLRANRVALGDSGPDFDAHRLPVDTIVIHHTSSPPGYTLDYLNSVHLLNIYAPYFVNPTITGEKDLKGKALWSGHFKDDKQVFWGYHWLMRMDGSFERLLEDNQLGWHAGNWGINCRSVALCLDNDYEKQDPADDILQKLATHIKKYYPDIKATNIIGHCEARQGTRCPGGNFLSNWKTKLLNYIDNGS